MAVWMKRSAFPLARGGVNASSDVLELAGAALILEAAGKETGSIVGHHTFEPDAVAREVSRCLIMKKTGQMASSSDIMAT